MRNALRQKPVLAAVIFAYTSPVNAIHQAIAPISVNVRGERVAAAGLARISTGRYMRGFVRFAGPDRETRRQPVNGTLCRGGTRG